MESRTTTSYAIRALDKENSFPYLFILLADTLTRILSLAGTSGNIQKMSSFPWPSNLVSLHYADDTLLLVPRDTRSFICLKLLLYEFGMMPRVTPRSGGTETLLRRVYAGRKYPHVYTLSISTGKNQSTKARGTLYIPTYEYNYKVITRCDTILHEFTSPIGELREYKEIYKYE